MDEPVRITLRTWHSDKEGKKGRELLELVGTRWFHPKSGHLYRISGYGFDSERERWVIHYRREGLEAEDNADFPFHHLPEDFFREGRFLRVLEGS